MTNPAHHADDLADDRTPAKLVDDVLTEISMHLRHLYSWMPLVREMADSQRHASNYIPASTRATLGRQHAEEHGTRVAAYQGGMRGTVSVAPGNFTSWALEADVELTLRHLLRWVVRRQPATAAAVPASETTEQLIERIRAAFMQITSLRVADAVLVDLRALTDTAARVLFGEDRTEISGPCPHCGRFTLVAYLGTGVIRCEWRHADGDRCLCDEPDCACRAQRHYEHHWLRDRPLSHPHSWQSLNAAQNDRRTR